MDQSDPVTIRDYGVYHCQWYTKHHKDCNKNLTTECHFWFDIREMNQEGTLGKMFPVIPIRVN